MDSKEDSFTIFTFSLVLLLTLIDNGLAIGAALGRESLRLGQLDVKVIRDDTFKDLLVDTLGFSLGLVIKMLLQ